MLSHAVKYIYIYIYIYIYTCGYTVYIRYSWQGNHQIYGHIRCLYTVLIHNPTRVCFLQAVGLVNIECSDACKRMWLDTQEVS